MRKNRSKRNKRYYKKIISLIITIAIVVYIINYIDYEMRPIILKMTNIHGKNVINNAINETVNNIIINNNIISSDFYKVQYGTDNEIRSIEINTILINQLCSEISRNTLNKLNFLENESIYIPLTSILDLPYLYGISPSIPIDMLPVGNVNVDYETSFISAGVNQTALEIWINVSSEIEVINPIYGGDIEISRRIPLVATVINGSVPTGLWSK